MEYLIIILAVTMLYFVITWKIDPDKWQDLDGIEIKAVKKRTRKSTTRDKTKKKKATTKKKKTTTKRKTKRKTK